MMCPRQTHLLITAASSGMAAPDFRARVRDVVQPEHGRHVSPKIEVSSGQKMLSARELFESMRTPLPDRRKPSAELFVPSSWRSLKMRESRVR
jgi:hypothetical protein